MQSVLMMAQSSISKSLSSGAGQLSSAVYWMQRELMTWPSFRFKDLFYNVLISFLFSIAVEEVNKTLLLRKKLPPYTAELPLFFYLGY